MNQIQLMQLCEGTELLRDMFHNYCKKWMWLSSDIMFMNTVAKLPQVITAGEYKAKCGRSSGFQNYNRVMEWMKTFCTSVTREHPGNLIMNANWLFILNSFHIKFMRPYFTRLSICEVFFRRFMVKMRGSRFYKFDTTEKSLL